MAMAHYDDWRLDDPVHRLPETCTGETIFELVAITPRATSSPPPGTALPQLPMDQNDDYWEKSGTTWAWYHKNYTCGLYRGGPGRTRLEDKRVANNCKGDSDYHIEDSWEEIARGEPAGGL